MAHEHRFQYPSVTEVPRYREPLTADSFNTPGAEMSLGPCMNPEIKGCRLRKQIGHHLYYPKRDYLTDIEKAFREKPEHIIQICACAEWLIHNTMPDPEKPPLQEMIVALTVQFDELGSS